MRVKAVMQPTSQPAALPVLPVGTVLKAAASELARSGQDAAVIEKAKRVLGRLRVRAADRFTFEDPFHIVYARSPRRRGACAGDHRKMGAAAGLTNQLRLQTQVTAGQTRLQRISHL